MGLLSQRFYRFASAFILTAATWGILQLTGAIPSWFSICLFKSFTGIPCPGCGATRAGITLLNGSIDEALLINPVALVFILILGFTALILTSDLMTGTPRLKQLFVQADRLLKKRTFLIPLILIILLNWSWSIFKGL